MIIMESKVSYRGASSVQLIMSLFSIFGGCTGALFIINNMIKNEINTKSFTFIFGIISLFFLCPLIICLGAYFLYYSIHRQRFAITKSGIYPLYSFKNQEFISWDNVTLIAEIYEKYPSQLRAVKPFYLLVAFKRNDNIYEGNIIPIFSLEGYDSYKEIIPLKIEKLHISIRVNEERQIKELLRKKRITLQKLYRSEPPEPIIPTPS
ncbi:MAG: hypothetical protein Q6351_005300 [Candidatus Njordarchaeum guaymaensis]